VNTAASASVGGRAKAVADGVWRIRLDSACGLVVNAYLLLREGHHLLIDTGFPYTTAQLEEGLRECGVELADIDDVLYTHLHVDHVGGGVVLGSRWGAREWVWEGATPAFGDVYAYLEGIRAAPCWPSGCVPASAATDVRVLEMQSKPRLPWRAGGTGHLHDPRGVAFGETLAVGPWRFECLDGRGHGPHHVGWLEVTQGWLFSGDAVMAVPTPIVLSMGDDLVAWASTVARWSSRSEVTWLLPGHGMPTRLIQPSFRRSVAAYERVYAVMMEGLGSRGVTDAVTVTRGVLPGDGTRFAARSSVVLSNAHALLVTLAAEGGVSEVAPGVFAGERGLQPCWTTWVSGHVGEGALTGW
jgi:glyoxylase-like metal-dependent hydrolase (beta-lactamase superfamily II)